MRVKNEFTAMIILHFHLLIHTIHAIILILRQLVLFVKFLFSSFPFFKFVCLFPHLD